MNTLDSESSTQLRTVAGKYLTFNLGRETYGIPVMKIREIIRLTEITTVPRMPDYVRGVINLRGKIVPVLDLRRKFGLPQAEATEHTCIIVVQINLPAGANLPMGLVVDGVDEVLNLAAADIEATPDFGAHVQTDELVGMGKAKGLVVALLDIDRVVGGEAEQLLQHTASAA